MMGLYDGRQGGVDPFDETNPLSMEEFMQLGLELNHFCNLIPAALRRSITPDTPFMLDLCGSVTAKIMRVVRELSIYKGQEQTGPASILGGMGQPSPFETLLTPPVSMGNGPAVNMNLTMGPVVFFKVMDALGMDPQKDFGLP